jgi:parallel beta-helix repeat protein
MFIRTFATLTLAMAIILAGGTAGAATYRVPGEYASIQAGIDAAAAGDTVLVAPGTYTGPGNREIDFHGINMVLISEEGAETTIIDCEGAGQAFEIITGEDSTLVISGFTMTNGSGGNGGCIDIYESAPTIEECTFSNNTASSNGGAIYWGYSPSTGYIRRCVFYGNSCPNRGGAINCDHGNSPYFPPVISDCVFYDNSASTGGDYGGGAIFTNYSPILVTRCTIVGNSAGVGAGGVHALSAPLTITRSVVAFNTGEAGAYNVIADQCVFYGNEGTDMFDNPDPDILELNPLFCDLENRILTYCSDSPCIPNPGANPWDELIGALDIGCGECASGTEKSSWGSIKRMIRE